MGRTRRVMVLSAAIGALAAVGPSTAQTGGRQFEAAADAYARKLLADGKRIFRFDTFGSEDFWSGRLQLHRAIQGQNPDGRYRTAPLRALWDTKKIHKGGFYHDGRFATLQDVVGHYDNHLGLKLSDQEKRDLIEYLKSL